MIKLTMPISDEDIRNLKVGDTVLLTGVMLTGRDAVHKWMIDTFVDPKSAPSSEDEAYEADHHDPKDDLSVGSKCCEHTVPPPWLHPVFRRVALS